MSLLRSLTMAMIRALFFVLGALLSPMVLGIEVKLRLNWTQGADHAPLYYAMEQGWFAQHGIDLQVTPGGGSAFTLEAVNQGEVDLGLVDLLTAMRGWTKGSQVIATMNVFAQAPHAFYWLKDSGIRDMRDFPGKRLGTLPEDPARKLWRALAEQHGIDPDSVRWVDLPHQMKVNALAEHRIDVATNAFFHNHAGYEAAFGARLVELPWRSLGFNPYSNSLIAHPDFVAHHSEAMSAIVRTLQQAIRFCLATPEPCLDALLRANTHLDERDTRRNWLLVEQLIRPNSANDVIGVFDAQRLQRDYRMVLKYFGAEREFDPQTRAINRFLEGTIRADN